MSREVNQFLWSHGVVITHSTPYHPTGNSQCERMNGTIWRGVQLALRSRGLPLSQWEAVLDTVLHSIRSLLCTATNETPHERLFAFSRKSTNGYSLPTWLSSPGQVLVRKFVRDKGDPPVESVELLSATPNYAQVRYPDGRESTVSTRDLAPAGDREGPACFPLPAEGSSPPPETDSNDGLLVSVGDSVEPLGDSSTHAPIPPEPAAPPPFETRESSLGGKGSVSKEPVRRSTRIRRPVVRLDL